MKNIEQAIAIEKEYLSLREQGIDTSLIEALKGAEYFSLEGYFTDKTEYEIKNCGMRLICANSQDSKTQGTLADINRTNVLILTYPEEDTVWVGDDPVDMEKCKDLGVKTVAIPYSGGTIITGADDISFCFIYKDEYHADEYFMKKLEDYLCGKCGCVKDKNDFLYEGKKICGMAFFRVNQMTSFMGEFSLSSHEELINEVCVKNAKKTAGFLPHVTKDDVKAEVWSWVQ